MKWQDLDKKLKKSGFKVFSGREFQAVTGLSAVAAKFVLIRYTKKGYFVRLKRDLYLSANRPPSLWFVANQIYKPSYISLDTALSYYGLIPESIYSVTSITAKSSREFEAGNHLYSYRTIKRQAFGGYRTVKIDGEQILIAEKEKALADYLYFVFLKRCSLNERLSSRGVKKKKVQEYLKQFNRSDLLNWYRYDFKITDHRIAR